MLTQPWRSPNLATASGGCWGEARNPDPFFTWQSPPPPPPPPGTPGPQDERDALSSRFAHTIERRTAREEIAESASLWSSWRCCILHGGYFHADCFQKEMRPSTKSRKYVPTTPGRINFKARVYADGGEIWAQGKTEMPEPRPGGAPPLLSDGILIAPQWSRHYCRRIIPHFAREERWTSGAAYPGGMTRSEVSWWDDLGYVTQGSINYSLEKSTNVNHITLCNYHVT